MMVENATKVENATTVGTAVEKAPTAAKADEPDKTMRKAARPASLVEKINQAAAEADKPDIRTTKQPLRIVFLCDWAVHCDNPDHTERRKKGCCRGYTGCGADGMGACP